MAVVVRAGGLAGYAQTLRAMGADPIPLLKQAGLSEAALRDPNKYIPYTALIEAIELPATQLGILDFGMRYAAAQDIDFLGALAVAMRNADTLFAAISVVADQINYHTTGGRIRLEEMEDTGEVFVGFEMLIRPISTNFQLSERVMSYITSISGPFTAEKLKPRAIYIKHKRLSPMDVYEHRLGIAPVFNAPFNGMVVDREQMYLKRPGVAADAQKAITEFINAQMPRKNIGIGEQAHIALKRLMRFRPVSADDLAAALGLHVRTLQRRLKDEGKTFNSVKDDVRRELAEAYLAQEALSLSNVSYLLGYADQAVLTRKCHDWFAATPQAVREQLRGGKNL